MTIEEKAQAYDEALKRAKNYCEGHHTDVNPQAAMEYVFPELKESEDERIRKELIEFVNNNTLSVDERHYRWIDWLKKQGQQKPAWSEEDEDMRQKLLFLMEEENSIDSWGGCYEWLQSLKNI